MTLAQLMINGPGDNVYVELSEFRLLPDSAVICRPESDENQDESDWSYVWLVVVPLDPPGHAAQRPAQIIVGTNEISCSEDIDDFCRKTTLTGLICNDTDSLDEEESELLKDDLAGVDPVKCYIFRSDQSPTCVLEQLLWFVCGIAVLALGIRSGKKVLQAEYWY